MHHHIEAALAKRSDRIVSIHDPIAINRRNAASYLNGFTIGVITSHVVQAEVGLAAPEPRRETRRILGPMTRAMLVISMLMAVGGASLAYGWQKGDSDMQGRFIYMVENWKASNKPYKRIGEYDRINGVRK